MMTRVVGKPKMAERKLGWINSKFIVAKLGVERVFASGSDGFTKIFS